MHILTDRCVFKPAVYQRSTRMSFFLFFFFLFHCSLDEKHVIFFSFQFWYDRFPYVLHSYQCKIRSRVAAEIKPFRDRSQVCSLLISWHRIYHLYGTWQRICGNSHRAKSSRHTQAKARHGPSYINKLSLCVLRESRLFHTLLPRDQSHWHFTWSSLRRVWLIFFFFSFFFILWPAWSRRRKWDKWWLCWKYGWFY